MENKNKKWTWAPVTHACNPSYPGGRNKDYGLKLTRENSSGIPYIEKPFTKIGLAEWLKVKALSSNPSTHTHTHTKVVTGPQIHVLITWSLILGSK
jgi:hypothetical protein